MQQREEALLLLFWSIGPSGWMYDGAQVLRLLDSNSHVHAGDELGIPTLQPRASNMGEPELWWE